LVAKKEESYCLVSSTIKMESDPVVDRVYYLHLSEWSLLMELPYH